MTKKKINELYCNTTIALTTIDKQEIDGFRDYLLAVLSSGSVNAANPVGGSLEETNISVWGITSEDIKLNEEPVLSENSPEDTLNENQATADVSKSGGFWNYIKGLFR